MRKLDIYIERGVLFYECTRGDCIFKKIDGYRQHVHTEFNGDVFIPRVGVLPENEPLFGEMFELAKVIEPSDWYRGGNDRGFWIFRIRNYQYRLLELGKI